MLLSGVNEDPPFPIDDEKHEGPWLMSWFTRSIFSKRRFGVMFVVVVGVVLFSLSQKYRIWKFGGVFYVIFPSDLLEIHGTNRWPSYVEMLQDLVCHVFQVTSTEALAQLPMPKSNKNEEVQPPKR